MIRGTGQYKTFSGDMVLNRPTIFSTAGTGGDWWTAFNENISGNVGTLAFQADNSNSRIALQSLSGKTMTFTGDVVVASGRLQLQGNAAIPDNSNVTVNSGAYLRVYNSETINGLNGSGVVYGDNSSQQTLTIGGGGGGGTFSGVIGSGGTNLALVKIGSGTETLSGRTHLSARRRFPPARSSWAAAPPWRAAR